MTGAARIRARVRVSGRVQGVAFRASTRRRAVELQLTGYVCNLRDGRVEAVFEGEAPAVEQAIDFMNRGPTLAYVQSVEEQRSPATGEFEDFAIR